MAAPLNPVRWMSAGALGTAAVAMAIAPQASRLAIALGVAGPLIATTATWLIVERAWQQDPLHVTPALLRAWAAKAVFFTAYVVMAIKGLGVAAGPFAVSLAGSFIVLYAAEAILFQRLFSRAWRGGR